MRKIKCDSCGGNSFKQAGGMYECIFCGSKYAIDGEGADREVVEAKVVALWEEAQKLHEANRYKEELDVLAKALELDERNPQTLLRLGRCYCGLDLLEKAADCYEKTLELDPGMSRDVGEAYAALGNIYYRRGDHAEALPYHEKARSLLGPDSAKQYCDDMEKTPERINEMFGPLFQALASGSVKLADADTKPKSKWKKMFS